uniref:Protein sigma-1-small n=2 Tax=Reovirales TaxID=2732541 RepID=SIG1S_REOVJ|nr:RecName: Full=Protein sigma-1-small; Short=Sigma1s; AltName: Full=Sigma-s; AltName: Full=Sigma1NS; AltName: Full=Sigma1bNS; AltName: Full=p14 [Mammalian orthoreovirus 2 D5/Jones]AAA47252.1 sigma-1-s protein [Mammalian orthoreovirus 2]AAA66880.1 unknown protein [Mammalian orthoreovirus 2 D5/Jones]AAB03313.1 non-structural protein sigma 1s [Reovirus sp.]AAB03315.1 non-structural protein sigma 1s [Reovirus sp.]
MENQPTRNTRSRKLRNKLKTSLLMSTGSVTSLIQSKDNWVDYLYACQPLNRELVRTAIELIDSSEMSPAYRLALAESIRVYPSWVTESMLQNSELASWIQSRIISLSEHQDWKLKYQPLLMTLDH